MELQAFAERIRSLIAKDDLKTAIKEMSYLLKNSKKLDEIILQSARFSELMQQIRMGTIRTEDASVNKNQIRSALLDLLGEVKQNASSDPYLLAEVEDVNFPFTQTSIRQNHSGLGDNVAGNKNTKNYVSINSIWIVVIIIFLVLGIWLVPELLPKPTPLNGYIVSNADSPVAGVTVTVKTPDNQYYKSITNEDGFFLFNQINLKKTNSLQIEASIKEQSVKNDFNNFDTINLPLIIQLPMGTPPFELSYYDIKGLALNYFFNGEVDKEWENRLGGQPFIIPNKIFKTFKTLGEKFNYKVSLANTYPHYETEYEHPPFPVENTPHNLVGVQTDSRYDGHGFEPTDSIYEDSFRKISGWRYQYPSPDSQDTELKSKQLIARFRNMKIAYYNSGDYSDKWFESIFVRISKNEMPFILEHLPYDIIKFLNYVTSENMPNDFIRLEVGFEECGDEGFFLNINAPNYHLRAIVFENNTNNPIAIDSFYILEDTITGLRLENKNKSKHENNNLIAKKLFPKKTLKPGDKILIPTALVFSYSEYMRNDDTKDNIFIYGPTWKIKEARVENQIFPFRELESELFALYYGGTVGSCPFVYTYSEEHGEWLLEDHILYGRSARYKKGFDEIELTRFTGEIIVREEDPETSFIDLIEIRFESEEGRSKYLMSNHRSLQKQDEVYYQMDQGDEIKLSFESYVPSMKGKFFLRSYGYYESYEIKQYISQ